MKSFSPPRGATKGGGAGWQRWEGQRRSRCQSLHPGATERKRGQGQAATAPTEPSGHSRTLRQHPSSSAGSVPFPPVTPLSPRPAPCPGLQVAKARSGGRPGLPGTGTCGTRGTLPPPTAASASSGVRARGGDSDISLPRGAPPAPGSAERPGDTPATRGDTPEPNPGTGGDTPVTAGPPRSPAAQRGKELPARTLQEWGGINASPPFPPGIAAGKGSGKRPGSAVPGKPSHQPSHQPSDSPVTKPVTIPSRSRG